MSIPKIAAILALAGIAGLLLAIIAHAGWPVGDLIFYASAICLILAAVIFMGDVIVKFWREVAYRK